MQRFVKHLILLLYDARSSLLQVFNFGCNIFSSTSAVTPSFLSGDLFLSLWRPLLFSSATSSAVSLPSPPTSPRGGLPVSHRLPSFKTCEKTIIEVNPYKFYC
ncbi:hypothetical protein Ddye_000126 [Dipteronia dyeriana]|uniref:Secreted protein n=1 Tax=Dipteronia dyeriana TaxID=168575 RepID=A0AAD9XLG1_9ROSI|nr:hypothetical protein Ddye_000126 [Dipteronia dyeriana]